MPKPVANPVKPKKKKAKKAVVPIPLAPAVKNLHAATEQLAAVNDNRRESIIIL
jgi:hypothetical protein